MYNNKSGCEFEWASSRSKLGGALKNPDPGPEMTPESSVIEPPQF
jgi:hypothetical protein